MINAETHILEVASIRISPDRQRKEMKGIEELAASIRRNGLINPIVVTPDNVLVAGERRLTAARSIGLSHIEARYTNDLSEDELQVLEFEENAKRVDLTWRENVAAIAGYHTLMGRVNSEWTAAATADALSITHGYVSRCVKIQSYVEEGDELVLGADNLKMALNIILRKEQRQGLMVESAIDSAMDEVLGGTVAPQAVASQPTTAAKSAPAAEAAKPPVPGADAAPFLHADFTQWALQPLAGEKFNFLHCDFPYGIGYDKHEKGSASKFGGYDDSPDVYFNLIETLDQIMDTHVAPQAHMMFWMAPKYLGQTRSMLATMGWKVNDYPLIWHRSDNSGVIPDPRRGPRQVYEICLFCTRGDRFIAQSVANLFAAPKTKEIHSSEKPRDMLRHFFRMFVDESTVMLDPTMGSGGAVDVAERMGAKFVLGLERDETFYGDAVLQYNARKREGRE